MITVHNGEAKGLMIKSFFRLNQDFKSELFRHLYRKITRNNAGTYNQKTPEVKTIPKTTYQKQKTRCCKYIFIIYSLV